jgi:hypothetical protein
MATTVGGDAVTGFVGYPMVEEAEASEALISTLDTGQARRTASAATGNTGPRHQNLQSAAEPEPAHAQVRAAA